MQVCALCVTSISNVCIVCYVQRAPDYQISYSPQFWIPSLTYLIQAVMRRLIKHVNINKKRTHVHFFHSFYLLLFLIFLNNRKREHYIIQSNSVITKIILLWILLKGCPTHVWIGHHKKYSSTHTLYLIFFGDLLRSLQWKFGRDQKYSFSGDCKRKVNYVSSMKNSGWISGLAITFRKES